MLMNIHLNKKLIILTCTFMFISCAHYTIDSYYDEFEKYNWTRYNDNFVDENYPGLTLQINPQIWSKEEENVFSIQLKLTASDWIHINSGKNLQFFIDGNKFEIFGSGSENNRKRISRRTVKETAWYLVDKEMLYNLAFAEVVKIKVLGDKEFIQATFSNENKLVFSEFYKNHIDETVFEIPAYAQKEVKSKWFFKSSSEELPEHSLENFYSLLELNGWSGNIQDFDWDYSNEDIVYIRNLDVIYELPEGENNFYYPEFRIYEIIYESEEYIPESNLNEFQIYPCANCPGKYPIEDYPFLTNGISEIGINNYENWMALRLEDIVYLIIGFQGNDHVGSLFGFLAQYFKSETMNDLNMIADKLSVRHKNNMEILESSMLIQEYLQNRGFYSGKLDGLFGKSSIMSFQKFLKYKKFYDGDLDGNINDEFKTAIVDYQKYLSVPETGWLNIEMAMNMK